MSTSPLTSPSPPGLAKPTGGTGRVLVKTVLCSGNGEVSQAGLRGI
jgi:hypothetical protein